MLTPFKSRVKKKTNPITGKELDPFLKEYTIFDLTGGKKTSVDPLQLKDNQLYDSRNCYYNRGRIKSRFGYVKLGKGQPLPAPIMQFEQLIKYDGTQYFVCFTTTNVYRYNSSTEYWDLITENALVDDCETAWTASANVTATASTTWCRYGTNSAKFVIAAGFTTGLIAYHNFSSVDLTNYNKIHLYIKTDVAYAAGDLSLVLDDTNNCVSPLENINLPALTGNSETEIEITINTPAALTAVLSVGLKRNAAFGAEHTIYIDDIRAVKCFTGDVSNKFCIEMIYDKDSGDLKFLATNGVDPIVWWDGTGNWADVPNSPDKCKTIKNFYNYLLLMNCMTSGSLFPQKVEWSVNGKPSDMTGSGSGNNSLSSVTGGIQGCEIIQGQLAILLERSIAMQYMIGTVYAETNTVLPFSFDENKIIDVGCAAGGSIQSLGASIIFLGWDNIYMFDGFSCNPIGDDIVRELLDSINPDKIGLAHSHIIEELGIYLLFVPSVGSSYPDIAWVYDYIHKVFVGTWKFACNVTANGYYTIVSAKTIAELTGKIGTFAWRIGSSNLEALAPLDVIGTELGYIYALNSSYSDDDGTPIESYFIPKAFSSNPSQFDRSTSLFVYGIGTTAYVYVSTDLGKSFTYKQDLAMGTEEDDVCKANKIETTSNTIMFKIMTTDWFEITGLQYKHIEKGEIK